MPNRFPLAVALTALVAACGADPESGGHWEGTPANGPAVDRGSAPGWPIGTPSAPRPLADAGAKAPADDGGPRAFACSGKPGSRGDFTVDLKVGSLDRSMIVHVPPKYDDTMGAPLVLNFHGFLMSPAAERDSTLMNATADARGFVVVYPAGVGSSWNAGDCCGQATSSDVDDIGFVKAAIAKIESDWCIDPKRVYAAGFSNGGFFTHRLACEMSDTFAAIAPVSGVLGQTPESCKPVRPISILEFHGTADTVVPYNGGVPISPVDFGGPITFRSVEATQAFWRTTNDCLGPTAYAKGDATCVRYDCAARTNTELCTLDGAGHRWPGGTPSLTSGVGPTSTDISASDAIADFFAAHALP